MFKKVLILAVAIMAFGLSPGPTWAHKPLLSVSDNNDGTMSIEGGFSDGSSAAGHKIILRNKETGEILRETKVGEDGTLDLKKPAVNFTVTLDAGEGHLVTQVGPPPSTEGAIPSNQVAEAPAKTESAPAPSATQNQQAGTGETAPGNIYPGVTPITGGHIGAPIPQQYPWDLVAGANMAFEMLLVTMIVTAAASVLLLSLAVYFIGYRMGSRSMTNTYGKEARGCSWCQDS